MGRWKKRSWMLHNGYDSDAEDTYTGDQYIRPQQMRYGAENGETALEDAVENEETVEVWKPYICRSLSFGKPHPGDIVEAASLSAVELPANTYPLQDSLARQIEEGTLSCMQLEGVMYASERHSRYLPDGRRCGFYVGDSAGVGKGRQMAGIILDNLVRGRSRHVWFSASRDLHLDATRDLRDIGCTVPVFDSVASLSKRLASSTVPEAVVFCTYTELVSKGRKGSTTTRYDELVTWLCGGINYDMRRAFDGVIIFDESHKAKNYFEGKGKKVSTKAGTCVVQLQEELPRARIVYSSATGVSSVENMGYMSRMGLWGQKTSFDNFGKFAEAIGGGKSVAALEMLALEFKATGCQVARNVGYQGAEFSTVSANLTATDAEMYRQAATLWRDVHEALKKANELCQRTPADGIFRASRASIPKGFAGTAMKMFWSAHQRFFRQLIAALKVPALASIAVESLKNGYSVVIGLQSTGESSLNRALVEELEEYGLRTPVPPGAEGFGDDSEEIDENIVGRTLTGQKDELVSICKTILKSFIVKWFPSQMTWVPNASDPKEIPYGMCDCQLFHELSLLVRDVPNLDKIMFKKRVMGFLPRYNHTRNRSKLPAYDRNGIIHDCKRMQSSLLDRVEKTYFPSSALDELIDRLGGPTQVAEMTGRSIRQVRMEDNSVVIQSRVQSSGALPRKRAELYANNSGESAKISLNVREKMAFMNGEKLVAIISEAASTGISLHADANVKNQRRRVHCTLELPWAGDAAIQQLGRSHRTNQTSAPIFRLLSSGLGGEHRFISSVSRRLQSLGALTQGDRRASVGAMTFGEFQYESDHGSRALDALYASIMNRKLPSSVDWRDVVRQSWFHMRLDNGELDVSEDDIWRQGLLPPEGHVPPKVKWCPPANPYMQSEGAFFDALEEAALFTGDLMFTQEPVHLFESSRKRRNLHASEPSTYRPFRSGPRRLVPEDDSSFKTVSKDVPRFFNRILGLPFSQQSLMFNLFNMLLEEDIKEAKRNGKFDRGVQILDGQSIERLRDPELLYRDPGTGGKLIVHAISRDRGVAFKDVIRELRYRIAASQNPSAKREDFPLVDPPTAKSLAMALNEACEEAHFFRSTKEIFGRYRTCLAIRIGVSLWKVIRPGTGIFSSSQIQDEVLQRNYRVITHFERLQQYWDEEYEWSKVECTHGPRCKIGEMCVVGRRKFNTNVLTGNVISLWSTLQEIISNAPSLPKSERIMSIVQTNITSNRERLVGVIWPVPAVAALREKVSELRKKHDLSRRLQVVHNLPLGKIVRRPDQFVQREAYTQKEKEYRSWLYKPMDRSAQLELLGFVLDRDRKVIETSPQAEAVGVRVNHVLYKLNYREATSIALDRDMREIIAASATQNYPATNFVIPTVQFLRPKSQQDEEDDERLWREGLTREPAKPVVPDALVRLVVDPKSLRLREEQAEDEVEVASRFKVTAKRRRRSSKLPMSSDSDEGDQNNSVDDPIPEKHGFADDDDEAERQLEQEENSDSYEEE